MARESDTPPREFLRKLREDVLVPPVRIVGMVKAQEDLPDELLFSQHCIDWVSIPVHMIQSIEHLGSAPCKDHNHPRVAIVFDEPRSPEARAFAHLLASYRPPPSPLTRSSLCSECLAKCRNYPPGEVFDCLAACKDVCPGDYSG
ncbi:hypothetical protein [Streptomyces hawaiiensis]|uniref:hypothetical protein n=1 Tax=Streptomyces hawaiiensis TaxID=67305 RepID=UPI0036542A59